MDSKTSTHNEYLKTKVMTASPEELQLILYDGAIRFCEQARQAIRDKNIEDSYRYLTKAENIVMEQCNSLKDEYDPETCANMRKLYLFCYEQLVQANTTREIEPLENALRIIRHLRETWIMLIEKIKQERAEASTNDSGFTSPADATPPEPVLAGADQPVGSFLSVEG